MEPNRRFTDMFWGFIIALIVAFTLIGLGLLARELRLEAESRQQAAFDQAKPSSRSERRSWYLLMVGSQKHCPPVDDRGWIYAGRVSHQWDGSMTFTWCHYQQGGIKQ